MPQPSSALATQRPDLGAAIEEIDLVQAREGFVGLRVMPVFEVAKQAGNYGQIPREELLNARNTERAPGSGYSRGNFTFDVGTYATQEYGAEEPVDDREAEMYADYFNAELVAGSRARDVVLRENEQRVAAALFNNSTFSATAVTNEWDDATNATPIADVQASRARVWALTGIRPNALLISYDVFKNLLEVDEITDKIVAVQSILQRDINLTHLAKAFDIDNIIVADSPKNTANRSATAVIASIWDDEFAMTLCIPRTNDIREICTARTIHWSGDGSDIGTAMESYRDETVRSNIIRARFDVELKLFFTETADLLENITS